MASFSSDDKAKFINPPAKYRGMQKRGQLALVLFTGIFVLLGSGMLLATLNTSKAAEREEIVSDAASYVTKYANSCLEMGTVAAVRRYGIDGSSLPNVKSHVEASLRKCMAFPSFESKGIQLVPGEPVADPRIVSGSIHVSVEFPITFFVQGYKGQVSQFSYPR